MVDMTSAIQKIASPIIGFIGNLLYVVGVVSVSAVFLFFLIFFIRYLINPFKLNIGKLKSLHVRFKWYDLLRWLVVDAKDSPRKDFGEYGFTFYCGRQGAGKTISMVNYLNRMRHRYPDCLIVTNFACNTSDMIMTDWRDIIDIRNGNEGVIFAIDEIHSEYSSASWRDFPESLLSEISQQRKQKVKIVATSQCFGRVAKPLREQAFTVVQCSTRFGRLTSCAEYDANEYSSHMSDVLKMKDKIKPLRKYSFVQSNYLRDCYDTYAKIERMTKMDFIPRHER